MTTWWTAGGRGSYWLWNWLLAFLGFPDLNREKSLLTDAAHVNNLLVMKPVGYAEPPGERLNDTFAALADPTRRAILARLTLGEASVTELAQPFAMSQPAISKHLRVLERAGLVARGRDAQRRPCRIVGDPLGDASRWLESYRGFWEKSFQRLDSLLAELQAEPTATASDTEPTETESTNA